MENARENLVRIVLLQDSSLDGRIKEAIKIETRCSSLNQDEAGLEKPCHLTILRLCDCCATIHFRLMKAERFS